MQRRPNPERQPPAVRLKEDLGMIQETRIYQLITPLFGGGVHASENDLALLIRGTSIRGQLRFWWRACFGDSSAADPLADKRQREAALLADMRRREAALWGSASDGKTGAPSLVQVMVEILNAGQEFRATTPNGVPVRVSAPNSPFGYAAFPLQDKPAATVREGIEFKLTISYPARIGDRNTEKEVQDTVWAWEVFGGIGGRTRRGFGALRCGVINGQPTRAEPHSPASIQSRLREIMPNPQQWPKDVPHLHPEMKLRVVQPARPPREMWAELLKKLKNFRQERNPGRERNRPGRSRWPEADALRRITGERARLHFEDITKVDAFPRAAFGLPIIFHFKDSGDPDATLQVEGHERFASPLILKPLGSSAGAVGLVAKLCGSTLDDKQLTVKTRRTNKNVRIGTAAELRPLTRSDGQALLSGESDPIDAFLAQF
mgnify:CR=1 FL=1